MVPSSPRILFFFLLLESAVLTQPFCSWESEDTGYVTLFPPKKLQSCLPYPVL